MTALSSIFEIFEIYLAFHIVKHHKILITIVAPSSAFEYLKRIIDKAFKRNLPVHLVVVLPQAYI